VFQRPPPRRDGSTRPSGGRSNSHGSTPTPFGDEGARDLTWRGDVVDTLSVAESYETGIPSTSKRSAPAGGSVKADTIQIGASALAPLPRLAQELPDARCHLFSRGNRNSATQLGAATPATPARVRTTWEASSALRAQLKRSSASRGRPARTRRQRRAAFSRSGLRRTRGEGT
jgi:hypothetical protein